MSEPNLIDSAIGANMRALREERGLSPDELAAKASLTLEDFVAAEAGESRLGARELFQLANALGVSAGRFFKGLTPSDPLVPPVETLDDEP